GFILFNIIGLCSTNNPIAWFAAMSLLMIGNSKFILRILNCSPQLLLSMLLMYIIALFASTIKNKPKASSFALILYICILRCIVPPEVYSLDNLNISYKYFWSIPLKDFIPLLVENSWLLVAPFIIWLESYKKKTSFISLLDDSLLFVALFLQLFINLGFTDLALFRDSLLLIWFSQKFMEIVNLSSCFKEARVKYSISLFVLIAFFLISTHDGHGRYSMHCIDHTPLDFSMKELKTWKPEPGGIIYCDDADFTFSQYYFNPDANYSYISLNSFSLFEKEKENLLNMKSMLLKKRIPLPDYYEDWVEQMNTADRLVTSEKINGLDNIEWMQCGHKRWIGKKKIVN
ncbi:MAG: hypothetical protein J6Z11_11020, partial [Candidatus Riflebacteria bacterium]|nr:hypothetical protein [Candidatus Riflebacteria bacterium]